MIRWLIRWPRRIIDALELWENARDEAKWLRDAERRFPRGALVKCVCGVCEGRHWWVHGYDVGAREVRVVSAQAALDMSWPPSLSKAECSWLPADPRFTKVLVR